MTTIQLHGVERRLRSRHGLVARLMVRRKHMAEFMSYALVPIAVIAVAIVLVLGLVNMMRGGSPHTSQKLMRMRVLLQFVAIVIIMLTIWAMGR
jgi:Hypoxia induced protein conserved region